MRTSQTTDCSSQVLYLAIELSNSKWKLAFSDGAGRKPRRREVPAGAHVALLLEIELAKQHLEMKQEAPLVSCYEAGRDGFWLHRCLCAHGIENIIVDSSSLEVNRRQRQAKTDRLDAEKLLGDADSLVWRGGIGLECDQPTHAGNRGR